MGTAQIPDLKHTAPAQPFRLPTSRFDGSSGPRILGPRDGKFVDLQSVGVRFMIWGPNRGHLFPARASDPARTLVAPLHLHEREDEYSYVLEGRMGALLGKDVVYAEPGDLGFKPRNQWHTFWNAGDTTCRHAGDHLAGRIRALLQRVGRTDGRGKGVSVAKVATSPSSGPAMATTSSRRASPGCVRSTGWCIPGEGRRGGGAEGRRGGGAEGRRGGGAEGREGREGRD